MLEGLLSVNFVSSCWYLNPFQKYLRLSLKLSKITSTFGHFLLSQIFEGWALPKDLLKFSCLPHCKSCRNVARVAVLGPGQRAQAPSFVATHDFLQRWQISDFLVLPIFRKVGKFAASIECLKTKSASASGGLCPTLSSHQGLCLWNSLQTPVIGSCYQYRACHGAVPPQMLRARTTTGTCMGLHPSPKVIKVNKTLNFKPIFDFHL